ncbi:MAG TPA: sulfotransferase [Nostoc sp.]|nr:sulfotransferase [Nostoc sp.]
MQGFFKTELPKLPLHLQILNQTERQVRRLGIRLAPFEPDMLREIAMWQSKLSDFDENPLFSEALEVLCRSCEADTHFSFVGRVSIREYIVRALVNRLRYVHARTLEPEVSNIALEPPVIVIGLPRSGTTFLHHLLALDPQARPLLFWELMEPIAGSKPELRRQNLNRKLANIKRMNAAIDRKHHFDTDNPEECMLLLDTTLLSLSFWVFAPVYEYLHWLQHQNKHDSYQVYRWYLQRFQRETPSHRLTLKAPAHMGALDALLDVIPNVRLVQIHRDPAQVVPSLHSLIFSLHAIVTESLDIKRMTEFNMTYLEHLITTTEAARSSGHSWVDVQYDMLVRDPITCVQQIYQQLNLTFTDELSRHIEQFVAHRSKEKFGKHLYSAEDFDTTEALVRKRFADYYQKYILNP